MMIRFLSTCVLICTLTLSGWSQIIDDSIQSIIKDLPDSSKVTKLNEISWKLRRSDLAKAINLSKEALKIARKIKDGEKEAKTLNYLGVYYRKIDDYVKASNYFFEALHLSDSLNIKKELAYAYNNLGQLFQIQYHYQEALMYYNNSLKLQTEINNTEGIAYANIRLSELYYELQNFDSVIITSQIAYELFKEIGNNENTIISRERMARAYQEVGETEKALTIYYETLNSEILSKSSLFKVYVDLAYTYLASNNPEKAIFYGLKAHAIKDSDIELLTILSSAYEKNNNYKLALLYAKLSFSGHDSMLKSEKYKHTKNLQIAYNTQDKIDENIELSYKLKISNLLVFSSIIIVFLTILIIIFIYKRRKKESYLNQILVSKNDQLEKLDATKNQLFSIIGHDLRNPIGGITSLVELLISDQKLADHEGVTEKLELLQEASHKTFMLLEHLLTWTRAQMKQTHYSPDMNNISEIINDSIDIHKLSLTAKEIKIVNSVPDELTAWFDSGTIETVFRNLISNAIKYTDTGGQINLNAEVKEHFIQMMIQDNGIGISKENVKDLFNHKIFISTYGTSGEKGTGLGLSICHEFIINNGGEIWVESEEGTGCTFYFTLPKRKPKITV